MRFLLLLLIGLVAVGCRFEPLPDPNEPDKTGMVDPEALRRQLKATSDMLNERQSKGEISEEQYRFYIEKRANEILNNVQIERIPPIQAWQYGELFRTAKRWKEAKRAFEIAVESAKKGNNRDRLVNDTVRLAHCMAALGEIEEAIATTRGVFPSENEGSVPILPATLYEIVPAAEGKGHDAELAKLLEDAIHVHMRTVVSPDDEAGRSFILARPHHVRTAWEKVITLYAKAGQEDEARRAINESERMKATMQRI